MRKQRILRGSTAIKLTFGLVLTMLCVAGFAQPIPVRNAEDLENVRNNMVGEYIQMADIDLEGINWNPLGGSRFPFRGVYDGNGHVIRNLTVERDGADSGLFGGLGGGGEIKNLGIINGNVTGSRNVGGLLAYLVQGTVSQCFYSGDVAGDQHVGGLIGFVGRVDGIRVDNSYAVGSVVSGSNAGGLIGEAHLGDIINCFAAAYVNGDPDLVGGLVGRGNEGSTVRGGFWDTEVSTVAESHGASGRTTEAMIQERTFSREWDFREVWTIVDEETYPFHQWQREPADHNYPPAEGQPSNLVARSGDEEIDLTWEEPSQGEWIAYNIYRDGARIAQIDDEETEYADRNVENYTTYIYYVTAQIDEETESRASNSVRATPHLPFAGGDGSEENPFQIATAQNLNDIRYNMRAHYIQVADIDISEMEWEPVGNYINAQDNHPFRGKYDGDGFSIEGFTIIAPDDDDIAFFGYLSAAEVTNMVFEEATILAQDNSAILAVRAEGETVISNCYISGEIEGNNNISGVLSYGSDVEIIGTHFDGTVRGRTRTTGLISDSRGTITIRGSRVSGNIQGQWQFCAGVIASLSSASIISDTHVDATIEAAGSDSGGFVGWNSGLIENSSFTGSIQGRLSVGGITGQNRGQGTVRNSFVDGAVEGYRSVGGITGNSGSAVNNGDVAIENCYVRGTVHGNDEDDSNNIGGIAGQSHGTITGSYSTASVTGPDGQLSGVLHRRTSGVVTDSYWNTETSGLNTSTGGGEGRLTRQMVYPYDDLTYEGWDFDEIWQNDPNELINDGYPVLFWQDIPEPIDPPDVAVKIITEDDVDISVLSWEAVEGARSYKIYATDNIASNNWGEPIGIVGELEFTEPVEEAGLQRFYRVIASGDEPPGE